MAEYTADGPLTREQLTQIRDRLRRMSDTELSREYDAAHYMCRLDREPPRASYVEQLFQTWRELERCRKSAAIKSKQKSDLPRRRSCSNASRL